METTTICARQTVQVVGPDGKVMTLPAGAMMKGGPQFAQPPAQVAPTPVESAPDGSPPEGGPPKDDGKAESAAPTVIRRDSTDIASGDASELKVRPDDDGKLVFSFRNQPWPALIQWLAEISDQPLDWQELPGDKVNLASPGRYTLAETRDLFNRHLLARGFTMLELDGGLTVVKTENINPAIVPRVDLKTLASQQPYSFVKTSFDCGWLLSGKLAEEFNPLISGNGKLVALQQTNRLEAMDAAINLQQIAELLTDEQSMDARGDLAREFELRHIPASEAQEMLGRFLGIDEDKPKQKMSPQMAAQMQMMQQQMMQQNGGQMPPQQAKSPGISIVVNNRRNSLLVNAPPDRMAVAAQFIKQVDVPSDSFRSLADIETRVQVFRLTSLDPAKLVEIVTDMNILEPSTRMRVDEKNSALIVSASAADRFVIKTLIDRLDGSARQFEVLQLRRLEAQEVAESIMFLMGTEEKEDSSNNRRMMFSYFGGGESEEKKDKDKFRVAANVRFRQVMLWANESEMSEVRNLLIKLGELPPEGGNASRIRRIEATASPETYEYLLKLKQRFGEAMPNTVLLPSSDAFLPQSNAEVDVSDDAAPKRIIDPDQDAPDASKEPNAPQKGKAQSSDGEKSANTESVDVYQLVRRQPPASAEPSASGADNENDAPASIPEVRSMQDFDRLFNARGEDRGEPSSQNESAGEPIRIELDEDGNLLLLSDDVQALDRLENLMLDIAPPRRPYTIFRVQHASATWISLSLEEYFESGDDSGSSEEDGFLRYLFDLPPKEDRSPDGLAKQRKLKFVSDNETGSIVVTGASTSQLKTIGELIELWDVPEAVDRRESRYTRLITLRYSRADRIAETIKEAYRDLLSSNDKAFSQPGGGQGGGAVAGNANGKRGRDSGDSELVDSDGGKSSSSSNFQFRGKLSIGVDQVGNTLLISTEGDDLLDLVCEMIDKLDQAAKPQGSMKIRDLPGSISVESLETALRFMTPVGSEQSAKRGVNAPAVNVAGEEK